MTSDEALAAARKIADDKGWTWGGDARVERRREYVVFGRRLIDVWSNADMRGCNVRVVFYAATGAVVSAHFLPR